MSRKEVSVVPSLRTKKFRNSTFVGEGSFGQVFKVRCLKCQKCWATKQIPLESYFYKYSKLLRFGSLQNGLSVLLREIRILSELNNPNIVRYDGFWFEGDCLSSDSENGIHTQNIEINYTAIDERISETLGPTVVSNWCFLQMEFCSDNLHNWLETKLPTQDDRTNNLSSIIFVLWQILNALEYIHSKGVVHRDLKPDNVFLILKEDSVVNPEVKLGDFGFASDMNHLKSEASGTIGAGSMDFRAPEVLKLDLYSGNSVPEYSPKADIFSLGLMTLRMIYPMDTNGFVAVVRSFQTEGSELYYYPYGEENDNRYVLIQNAIDTMVNFYPENRCEAKELLDIVFKAPDGDKELKLRSQQNCPALLRVTNTNDNRWEGDLTGVKRIVASGKKLEFYYE